MFPEAIRAVRTLWRQRDRWVAEAGRAVQRMQKALTTMNVQLANTIGDLSGVTGQAILRAIVAGTRDPGALATLRDRRNAASEEEIARSLQGTWRAEVLFELRQALEAYDFYQQQRAACDRELAKYTAAVPSAELPPPAAQPPSGKPARRAKSRRKHQPAFDLAGELHRTMGVDLTRIDGIDVLTAQAVFSEIGPDFRAFPDEHHFASWLTLAPQRDLGGGKVLRHVPAAGRHRVVLITMGCGIRWTTGLTHVPSAATRISYRNTSWGGTGLAPDEYDIHLEYIKGKPDKDSAYQQAARILARSPAPAALHIFYGGYGVGKTGVLKSLVAAFARARIPSHYVGAEDILAAIRHSYNESNEQDETTIMQDYGSYRVLAIDEIDRISDTPWARATLFRLLDLRYRQRTRLCTLLATNAQPEKLSESFDYLKSRLKDGALIHVGGADMRGSN